jgi:hypothetical protein
VFRKALANDREDRYRTCAELIEAAAGALGLAAPRAPSRSLALRRRGRLLLAGGLLLLAATVAAVIAATGGGEDGDRLPARNGIAALDGDGVASFTGTGIPPSSLAVGEGGIWALSLEDRTVTRIDPETKKVVKRFRMPAATWRRRRLDGAAPVREWEARRVCG